MNPIINSLSLIADAAEYLDRSTSAAWRIRAALTNMAVWSANGLVYLEENQPDSERLHRDRIKLSTIRCWLRDCNASSFALDLTPGNVRKTLGLERITDPHEDACRIARTKCVQTRSAANFAKYYTSALELAEARKQQREHSVERIANILSDHGWTLEGQVFDARGYDTLYKTPTRVSDETFVSDEDLMDEDLMEAEIDKLTDVLANALEAMYVEVDNQLAGAIVTAKINRLAGYKVAIEQMMGIVGVDKAVLARRQVQLEQQLEAERKLLDSKAQTLDEQIAEQMAAMQAPTPAPETTKPKIKPAAERKAAREARLAAKTTA